MDDEVISLNYGSSDEVWVGTYGGINSIVPTGFEYYSAPSYEEIHSLVAIEAVGDSAIIIGTYHGLFSFQESSQKAVSSTNFLPDTSLAGEKIMSLHIDKKGVWIGYRSSGLIFFPFKTSTPKAFGVYSENRLSSDAVSAILTAKNGETIVGTYGGGLNIIRRDGEVEFLSIGDNKVIMLYQTTDTKIWVGTESGLYTLTDTAAIPNRIEIESPRNTSGGVISRTPRRGTPK
jgi:ligand-binding sensor domain-containing protein